MPKKLTKTLGDHNVQNLHKIPSYHNWRILGTRQK